MINLLEMGIFPVCYGRDHVSGILLFCQNVCIGDVLHLVHGELLGVEQLVGGVGDGRDLGAAVRRVDILR